MTGFRLPRRPGPRRLRRRCSTTRRRTVFWAMAFAHTMTIRSSNSPTRRRLRHTVPSTVTTPACLAGLSALLAPTRPSYFSSHSTRSASVAAARCVSLGQTEPIVFLASNESRLRTGTRVATLSLLPRPYAPSLATTGPCHTPLQLPRLNHPSE